MEKQVEINKIEYNGSNIDQIKEKVVNGAIIRKTSKGALVIITRANSIIVEKGQEILFGGEGYVSVVGG